MKKKVLLVGSLLMTLAVAGCTTKIPVTNQPTSVLTQESTQLQATINSLETQLAAPTSTASITPTSSPVATPTLTATPTPLPPTSLPTTASIATASPTSTQVGASCNQAALVADVTIPNGTAIVPGASFVKTWRLRNAGTCTWSPDYRIVWASGDWLGGPTYSVILVSVPPGQTIDLSLQLTAPMNTGIYRANYKLADASGNLFGIGASNAPFYVQIAIIPSPTPTVTGTPTVTPTATP
jgi:hypothetical protein